MPFPNNLENQEQLKPIVVYGLEHLKSGVECLVNLHENENGMLFVGILPSIVDGNKIYGSTIFGALTIVDSKIEIDSRKYTHQILIRQSKIVFKIGTNDENKICQQNQIEAILIRALSNSNGVTNYPLNLE